MYKRILVALFLLPSVLAFSQDASSELPSIKANDFFLQFGSFQERGTYSSLSDFKKLAPNSQLLNMDLTGFDQYFDDWYGSPVISTSVGFRLRNAEGTAYRKSPILRTGISFVRATPYSLTYDDRTETRIDTLYSQPGGMTLYVDSISQRYLEMDYTSDQLRFDFAVLFRTNPEARWSLFGGAGINLGWSFNNYTTITYSGYDYTEVTSSDQSGYHYAYADEGNHEILNETHKNKGGFNGSFYVPLGIDFKIARRGEFFSRLHLFYEFRPGINYLNVSELGGTTRYFLGNFFGLRINWQD